MRSTRAVGGMSSSVTNLLARAAAALADGRIRHLGFSFHGDFAAL